MASAMKVLVALLCTVSTVVSALDDGDVAVEPAIANLKSHNKRKVPAIFVFGDSTVDVGNNNFLTGAHVPRADHPHYGIDFKHEKATGRFSNGKNLADLIAGKMGYELSPTPYLELTAASGEDNHDGRAKLAKGVNYASAGSGLFDSTGFTIPMARQIDNFALMKAKIVSSNVSQEVLDKLLSESLFLISSGSNDIFKFILETKKKPNATQIKEYYAAMILTYRSHLLTLHYLGARKFAIVDVPPIGCVPEARAFSGHGECDEFVNKLAKGFNDELVILLRNFSSQFTDVKYSLGSSYAVIDDMIKNPHEYGIKVVKCACCGGGRFYGETGCEKNSSYCHDRKHYIFWDQRHGTEHAAKKLARVFDRGSPPFVMPINLRELVRCRAASAS